jgi:hypothetical protein
MTMTRAMINQLDILVRATRKVAGKYYGESKGPAHPMVIDSLDFRSVEGLFRRGLLEYRHDPDGIVVSAAGFRAWEKNRLENKS